MTTINLTQNEKAMLEVFINESLDSSGEFMEDNMSFCNANELAKALNWNKQKVGGVMAQLVEKGCIVDSGESTRGLRLNDFVAEETNEICIALYNEMTA